MLLEVLDDFPSGGPNYGISNWATWENRKRFKHEIAYLKQHGHTIGNIREIFRFQGRTYARVRVFLLEERVLHLHGFDEIRLRPRWDGDSRRLFVGYKFARKYPSQAKNCIKVLSAFESVSWRSDKLSLSDFGIESPEQLKRTVSSLKGGSRSPSGVRAPTLSHITFAEDDGGLAITWKLIEN